MILSNHRYHSNRAIGVFRQLLGTATTPGMAQRFRQTSNASKKPIKVSLAPMQQPIHHHCGNPLNALLEKSQPVRRLARELNRPGYHPTPLTLGTTQDPYQAGSKRLEQTRGILQLLLAHKHPVHIITKSHLIVKDLDILAEMAEQRLCTVEVCLHTLDTQLSRQIEPNTSSPTARLKTISRLSDTGIPVGANVAPLIPVVNDADMEQLLSAAKKAGAWAAGYQYLDLPTEALGDFQHWLEKHYPEQAERILRLSQANVNSCAAEFARMVQQRFQLCCQKLNLSYTGLPLLDTTLFQVPSSNGLSN
ncbi:radical SAM protein [bacterium SCSIO 12696]|nr:radical SAM protein [bacterium SCSIO 12696]